jgi:hypothetical protein
MVVMGMIGKVIYPDKVILNVETLESGIKLIWCDHTVNSIVDRIEEMERHGVSGTI